MIVDKMVIQRVLGGLMIHPQYLGEIDKYTLTLVDFSNQLERYVFSAIYGLYQNGVININPIDIRNYLNSNATAINVFDRENGTEYLYDIIDYAREGDNFDFYYKQLKKINLLNDLQRNGFDTSMFYIENVLDSKADLVNSKFNELTSEQIITTIRKKLLHLETKYKAGEDIEVESVADGLDDFFEHLKAKEDLGLSLQGNIFTEVIGGAKKGTLTIRSAASGVGKSRNAVGDCCYLAYPIHFDNTSQKWILDGHCEKVIYVVTEQSFHEIRKMILAYLTGINESKFKFWDLTEYETLIVQQARHVMEMFEDNLTLVKMPSPTIELVKTTLREQCLLTAAEYIFFDYIFINPSLINEFKGVALRNDEILLMFATALKDLAVELDVCMFTSTQLNAKGDDGSNIRNESALAGGRATINKADYGCIMARPTKEELEILRDVNQITGQIPNLVTDMFKVRDGAYTQVKIWSYMDFGCLRKTDLFITDSRLDPLENFSVKYSYDIITWNGETNKQFLRVLDELNNGEIDVRL